MFKTYKTNISPSLIVITPKLTKFSKVTQNQRTNLHRVSKKNIHSYYWL